MKDMFKFLRFNKKSKVPQKGTLKMTDYNFVQDPISGFVGFMDLDAVLKAIQSDAGNPDFDNSVFPYFNIHSNDKHYMVDLSIPGYADADLTIAVANGVLNVTGKKVDAYEGVNSVYNGDHTPLGFSKSFRLYDTLVVETIKHVDGILSIAFVKMLPDPSREGFYPVTFTRGVTPMIVPPAPEPEPVVEPTPEPVANTEPVVEPAPEPTPAPVDPIVVTPEPVANAEPAPVTPEPVANVVVEPTPAPVDPAPVANT